jgi:hypothetical protein
MATDVPHRPAPHPPGRDQSRGEGEQAQAQELEITQDVLPSGLPLMPRSLARRFAALTHLRMRPTP